MRGYRRLVLAEACYPKRASLKRGAGTPRPRSYFPRFPAQLVMMVITLLPAVEPAATVAGWPKKAVVPAAVPVGASCIRKRSSRVMLKMVLNGARGAGCGKSCLGAAAFSDVPVGLTATAMKRAGLATK